jgi:H+/gluconate symporter-like permease
VVCADSALSRNHPTAGFRFIDTASRFIAQFFPLFLLGALFGKLMEDSGSVATIARFMTE